MLSANELELLRPIVKKMRLILSLLDKFPSHKTDPIFAQQLKSLVSFYLNLCSYEHVFVTNLDLFKQIDTSVLSIEEDENEEHSIEFEFLDNFAELSNRFFATLRHRGIYDSNFIVTEMTLSVLTNFDLTVSEIPDWCKQEFDLTDYDEIKESDTLAQAMDKSPFFKSFLETTLTSAMITLTNLANSLKFYSSFLQYKNQIEEIINALSPARLDGMLIQGFQDHRNTLQNSTQDQAVHALVLARFFPAATIKEKFISFAEQCLPSFNFVQGRLLNPFFYIQGRLSAEYYSLILQMAPAFEPKLKDALRITVGRDNLSYECIITKFEPKDVHQLYPAWHNKILTEMPKVLNAYPALLDVLSLIKLIQIYSEAFNYVLDCCLSYLHQNQRKDECAGLLKILLFHMPEQQNMILNRFFVDYIVRYSVLNRDINLDILEELAVVYFPKFKSHIRSSKDFINNLTLLLHENSNEVPLDQIKECINDFVSSLQETSIEDRVYKIIMLDFIKTVVDSRNVRSKFSEQNVMPIIDELNQTQAKIKLIKFDRYIPSAPAPQHSLRSPDPAEHNVGKNQVAALLHFSQYLKHKNELSESTKASPPHSRLVHSGP